MATLRISVDIDQEDHRYLKLCCVKLGVSIKDFVVQSVRQKVEEAEDGWLFNEDEQESGNNFVLIDHSGCVHAIPS